jgi:hypothetical protein
MVGFLDALNYSTVWQHDKKYQTALSTIITILLIIVIYLKITLKNAFYMTKLNATLVRRVVFLLMATTP